MSSAALPQIIPFRRGAKQAAPFGDGGPMVGVIGNFDGVHKGHQHLIATAKSLAIDLDVPLAVLTFSPHPRAFFRPQDPPFLLMDRTQKYQALARHGDVIIEIAFDEALRQASPQAFIQEVLQPLQIVHLFAGADFAFGKARAGTMDSLTSLGAGFGMQATGVPLALDGHQMVISSSRVRAALQAGQVGLARDMLGGDHVIAGMVIKGDQRGRVIGFPTANLSLSEQLHPAFGVYAIEARIGTCDTKSCYQGVANIGIRPTVNDRGVLAEAHLFDFHEDIYGQRIEIALKGYVRAEMKFEGLEALKAQIRKDSTSAKDMLAAVTNNR